ncbi:hypothetical protein V0R48_19875 [Pseudomonas alcaligenes]|jgi:hypothetical protein|uniref:hypothetical protein n=1 Tax=Aquipseudomonas alcaligenes TaxID=43263 RepID=UPI002E7BA27E|nr:hypothetical protein [Pseudomonas alcaligenes]MEE1951241.1 hypothetical protein [Pseudomonas alcaligenes]
MSQQPHDLQQERELLEHFRQHSQGEPSAAVDALILDAARQAVSPPAPRPNPVQHLHAWLFGAGSRTRWSVAVAGLAVVGIGLNLALHTRDQLPPAYDAPAPASAPALQEMAPVMEARKQSAEPEYKKAEQAQRSSAGSTSFAVSPAANAAPRPIAPTTPQAAAPVGALADSAAPVEADVARDQAQATAMLKQKVQSEAPEKPLAEASPKVQQETLNEDQLAETLGHSAVPEAPPLELRLRTLLQLRREGKQAEADRLLAALKQEFPQRDLESELKRLQREAEKPASSR